MNTYADAVAMLNGRKTRKIATIRTWRRVKTAALPCVSTELGFSRSILKIP